MQHSVFKITFGIISVALLYAWGVGMLSLDLPKVIPWSLPAIKNIVLFSLVFAVCSIVLMVFLKKYVVHTLTVVFLFLTASSVGFAPVFTVFYILASSLLLGDKLLNFLSRFHVDNPDSDYGKIDLLLSIFVGLGIFASILGPMMYFKVHYTGTYLFILAIPFVLNRLRINIITDAYNLLFGKEDFSLAVLLPKAVLIFFAFIHLFAVLLPEVSHDGLAVHLMIPAYVNNNHFWPFDVTQHIWAVMPMNADWLYTMAYMLGGEYASRILNYSFFLLVLALLFQFGKYFVSTKKLLWIVILFFSTPLVFLETGNLFVDNFWVAMLFASTVCLYLFHVSSNAKYFLLIPILAGVALSVKFGTVAYLPLLLIFSLYSLRNKKLPNKPLLILTFFALFVVLGGQAYFNAYLVTGNPIFPFFNKIFQSPFYDTAVSFNQPLYKSGINFDTLYDATFNSSKYAEGTPGALGFSLLVLLPLSLLLLFIKRTYVVITFTLIASVFIVTTFLGQSYLRYVYPAMPLLFLLIAMMWQEMTRLDWLWITRGLMTFGLISIVINLLFLSSSGWSHRDFRVDLLLDADKDESYLAYYAPVRKAVEFVNLVYGSSAKVGFLAAPVIVNLKSKAYLNNWYNYGFSVAMANAKTEKDYLAVFKQFDLTHFIVTPDKIKQIGPLLEKITDKVFSYNDVSVLVLKTGYLYTEERLKNGQFDDTLTGWSKMPKAKYLPESQSVLVTLNDAVTQLVTIKPGTRYLLQATARCESQDNNFRLQVNWLNDKVEIINTSLRVKPCNTQITTESEEVISPKNAAYGVVFVTGHTDKTVEFFNISLKE